VTHGPISTPNLRRIVFANGEVRIAAHCSECGCHLGLVALKRALPSRRLKLSERFAVVGLPGVAA